MERLDIDVNGESQETGQSLPAIVGQPEPAKHFSICLEQYDEAEEEQYRQLKQSQGQPKHVPGFQVQADAAANGKWDSLMTTIPQESPNGNYITDFAELDGMFKTYSVYRWALPSKHARSIVNSV